MHLMSFRFAQETNKVRQKREILEKPENNWQQQQPAEYEDDEEEEGQVMSLGIFKMLVR